MVNLTERFGQNLYELTEEDVEATLDQRGAVWAPEMPVIRRNARIEEDTPLRASQGMCRQGLQRQ
ncbi:MAG: hypothetical protein U5K84_05390 [Alkalibacterium sp.]|nr:hypothetical protein [Alkalibacterium sp.]